MFGVFECGLSDSELATFFCSGLYCTFLGADKNLLFCVFGTCTICVPTHTHTRAHTITYTHTVCDIPYAQNHMSYIT